MSTKIKCKHGKLKVPVRRPDGGMRYCKYPPVKKMPRGSLWDAWHKGGDPAHTPIKQIKVRSADGKWVSASAKRAYDKWLADHLSEERTGRRARAQWMAEHGGGVDGLGGMGAASGLLLPVALLAAAVFLGKG
jgi:hypothetical protein